MPVPPVKEYKLHEISTQDTSTVFIQGDLIGNFLFNEAVLKKYAAYFLAACSFLALITRTP